MKFGDIIRYREKLYVYLAATPGEIVHLAWILNPTTSKNLISGRERAFVKGSKDMVRKQESPAWCFVVLSTKEFEKRAAFYGRSESYFGESDNDNENESIEKFGVLSSEDQKKLKAEITRDPHANKDLRRHIGSPEFMLGDNRAQVNPEDKEEKSKKE